MKEVCCWWVCEGCKERKGIKRKTKKKGIFGASGLLKAASSVRRARVA
jgi:hypothetical protein